MNGFTLIVLAETDLLDRQIISLAAGASKIIGVDGGCAVLHRLSIRPDLILGDFDSLDHLVLQSMSESGVEVLTFPQDKDMTDGELAVLESSNRGWPYPLLTGTASSSETDHILGNIFLLTKYPDAILRTRREIIRCAGPGTLEFLQEDGISVSIIPLEPAVFKLQGFRYDGLQKVIPGDTKTLRNRLREERGILEVKLGKILTIQGKEEPHMI